MGVYNPSRTSGWCAPPMPIVGWKPGFPATAGPRSTPRRPICRSHPLTLFSKVGLYLDAAETFWQQWVVGYDPNHQGTLADRIEQAARRAGDRLVRFALRAGIAVGGAGQGLGSPVRGWRSGVAARWRMDCGLAGPRLWRALRIRRRVERVRRGEANVADATLLYERMLQVLRAAGISKAGLVYARGICRRCRPPDGARGAGIHRRLQRLALRRPQEARRGISDACWTKRSSKPLRLCGTSLMRASRLRSGSRKNAIHRS